MRPSLPGFDDGLQDEVWINYKLAQARIKAIRARRMRAVPCFALTSGKTRVVTTKNTTTTSAALLA
jgi:hypothetical protein